MIRLGLSRPLRGRLGARLVVAFGIALLPMAILAYTQAARVQDEARARSEAALFGETLQSIMPEVRAITRMRGAAAALTVAALAERDDPAACSDLMRRTVTNLDVAGFAAYITLDGRSNCASTGQSHDFGQTEALGALIENPVPTLTVNPRGQATGESVLIKSQPVFDQTSVLTGFVSISMPHRALAMRSRQGQTSRPEPEALVTFDANGTVLTALHGINFVEQRLPLGRPLSSFVGSDAVAFTTRTTGGDLRTFAVMPIAEESIYVLSSWPVTKGSAVLANNLPLWAFPLLMWMASLLVAILAAEFQVLRHVRALKKSIIAFAGGNRAVNLPDLREAPSEIVAVGDAFERMVDSVLRDEAQLEDSLHQREVLLREVHHRVKNNLQLIASIMNIQMRKAASPEAKALVKGLHDRVMSLATVHRELYQTSGLADVQADELLSTIVSQVLRMGAGPDRRIDLTTDFERIRLTPDQSVPLSLAMTEALTNVLKHAGQGKGRPVQLSVSLKQIANGRAILRVANSAAGPDGDDGEVDSTGLGQQLFAAFAQQLDGTVDHGLHDGEYAVVLDFPLRPLVEGEERFGPPAATPDQGKNSPPDHEV